MFSLLSTYMVVSRPLPIDLYLCFLYALVCLKGHVALRCVVALDFWLGSLSQAIKRCEQLRQGRDHCPELLECSMLPRLRMLGRDQRRMLVFECVVKS